MICGSDIKGEWVVTVMTSWINTTENTVQIPKSSHMINGFIKKGKMPEEDPSKWKTSTYTKILITFGKSNYINVIN